MSGQGVVNEDSPSSDVCTEELIKQAVGKVLENFIYSVGEMPDGPKVVKDSLLSLITRIICLLLEINGDGHVDSHAKRVSKIIALEGAARAGKTNMLLMIEKIFSRLFKVTTLFIDLQSNPDSSINSYLT